MVIAVKSVKKNWTSYEDSMNIMENAQKMSFEKLLNEAGCCTVVLVEDVFSINSFSSNSPIMFILYIVNLKSSSVFIQLFDLICFWLIFVCSAKEKLFSDFVFALNEFNYKMKYGINLKKIGFANGRAVIIFIVNCGYF